MVGPRYCFSALYAQGMTFECDMLDMAGLRRPGPNAGPSVPLPSEFLFRKDTQQFGFSHLRRWLKGVACNEGFRTLALLADIQLRLSWIDFSASFLAQSTDGVRDCAG
jgi:hypothetical protein